MMSERIKLCRERLGLTQAELARKMSVTRTCVSGWEMSLNKPSHENILELARLFNVSIDYIYGAENRLLVDISHLDNTEQALVNNLVGVLSAKK